jgi:hypothetical protein
MDFVRRCDTNNDNFNQAEGEDRMFGTCFSAPFPKNAVAIKATFNHVNDGVSDFDTSAAGMKSMLQREGLFKNEWLPAGADPNTGSGGSLIQVNNEEMLKKLYSVRYRMQDQDKGTYVLTGLHVITKEIPEWVWISLWWSTTPNKDFGSDRPAHFMRSVGEPWQNYKMCVSTTFAEQDPVILNGALASPRLNEWQQALHASLGADQTSWCSNPFIEHMPQGGQSNCIGCHQHGGPEGVPVHNLSEQPDKAKIRTTYPGDFMTSFHGSRDNFKGIIEGVMGDISIEESNGDMNMKECELDTDLLPPEPETITSPAERSTAP